MPRPDPQISYAAIIHRSASEMAHIFPEKTYAEAEAIASMAMDTALQHGFTEDGYNAFLRLMELEG
jgi:hypothetical protein